MKHLFLFYLGPLDFQCYRASIRFFDQWIEIVLKSARKGHTKAHTMYTMAANNGQKKERGNKKLLLPSNQTQAINKINYGLWAFAYKQFGPG